ncbi:MAG TPA: c-type cytochrome domain-containing protein [Tepidisphaeraceae bacterium]|nr:c-type cytochrome domain-containing protein [Tepidisphaeraceae bacterium]
MSKLTFPLFLALFFVALPAFAADVAPAGPKAPPIAIAEVSHAAPVDFEKEILPFLNASCMACHNKTKAKAGLVLETPADIRKGGDDGAAVLPGKGAGSLLLKAAAHAPDVESPMPPPNNKAAAANLTPGQLGLLRLWIDQGATGEVHGSLAPLVWHALPATLDPIFAVAVSPDGRLAACGRGNRIDVYDLPGQRFMGALSDPALNAPGGHAIAHHSMVESLAFSPDSIVLASGSYREVKLWKRPAPGEKFVLGASAATCIAVNPAGTLIATGGGDDGAVHLWNASTGKPAGDLAGPPTTVTCIGFSPDGARLLTASADMAVRVWDVAGKKLFCQAPLSAQAPAIAWLAKGKQIAAGGTDGVIRLFSLPEAADGMMPPGKELKCHDGAVTALEYIASNAHLLSGGHDGTIRRWNIDAGSADRQIKIGAPVVSLAVSQDGKRIADTDADGHAKLWNLEDAKELAALTDRTLADRFAVAGRALERAKNEVAYRKSHVDSAQAQVKSAAERLAKSLAAIPVADKALADKQKALEDAKAAKDAAASAKDDNKKKSSEKDLATAGEALKKSQSAKADAQEEQGLAAKADDEARQLLADATAASAKALGHEKLSETQAADAKKAADAPAAPARGIAFSPDGTRIVTVAGDGTIHLWGGKNGAPGDVFGDHAQPLTVVTFAGNNKVIACSSSGPPRGWDISGGWTLLQTIASGNSDLPFADRVTSLDFSPSGNLLATGGGVPSRSGEVRLFDLPSCRLRAALDAVHSDTVQCVRFSPDGEQLATASTDRFVKILDVQAGKIIRALEGHGGQVLGVAWKHDGHGITSASADNTLRFWDAETGGRGKVVRGFDKEVTCVAWVGDGDTAVAASGEGKVRLIRENGSDVRSFGGATDFVNSVAATPDGAVIVAGGQDGILRVWNANSGQSIATFKASEAK